MAPSANPASVMKDAALAMEMILKTHKYSDMTITCRGHVFEVHRNIICARSKPLAAAIDGHFKESITNNINLDEDEPLIVDKLIEFLYMAAFDSVSMEIKYASVAKAKATFTELAAPKNPAEEPLPALPDLPQEDTATGPLVTLAKVYIIADTFDVRALRDLAKAKYDDMVQHSWNSQSFTESIRLLYENTRVEDRDIKDIAIEAVRNNMSALLKRADFRILLADIGDIGLDVLSLAFSDEILSCEYSTKLECQHCQQRISSSTSGGGIDGGFVRRSKWFYGNDRGGCYRYNDLVKCGGCKASNFVPT